MKTRNPLRRRTPLRSNPETTRAWRERTRARLRRTPILKANPERLKRLRAGQFGVDGKREWIMGLPSALTDCQGWEGDPIDPAHVDGTRGAGAGPEGMAPLRRSEHQAFDSSMTDERFIVRYGRSREYVRHRARELERAWQQTRGAKQ